jgi:peptide/nickel transport system permease protein
MRLPPARVAVPALLVALLVILALAAPFLGLPDPIRQNVARRLAPPAADAWLGRDEFGRDVLARLIFGARTSLFVAAAATCIAALAGTLLGLIGGWFRGIAELFTVRVADVVLCFPPILLALLVVTVLGPGVGTLILMLSILYTPGFTRVAYGEILTARNMDYVEAVRALGAATPRILARTILPNIAGPLLVQFSLTLAAAIVIESGLSFLGLGTVPPTPSWGLMIRGARATMDQAPLLLLWPCLLLTTTILAINLLCDALRDLVDPRSAGPHRGSRQGPDRPRGARPQRRDRDAERAHRAGHGGVVRRRAGRDARHRRRERLGKVADRDVAARPVAADRVGRRNGGVRRPRPAGARR